MPGGGHEKRNARRFFRRIERSLDHAGEILVLGPSTAKLEFVRYLRKHARSVERRVVGIETMAQPTDAQLNLFTQEYFPSRIVALGEPNHGLPRPGSLS
jgi:stalled ribosome rescue protein Dom34